MMQEVSVEEETQVVGIGEAGDGGTGWILLRFLVCSGAVSARRLDLC